MRYQHPGSPDDSDWTYCPRIVYGITHGHPSSMQGRMRSNFYGHKILNGIKDPTTDLWTLPITPTAINETGSQKLGKDRCDQKNPPTVDCAAFAHSVRTRANAVKFSHQSRCNPMISSLMKALKKGFLKGCLDLSEELVTKYLNPSPATAKGHMKRPKKGIWSTKTKPLRALSPSP